MWKGNEFICETCGKTFYSRHKQVRFCSNKCRGKKCNNFLKDKIPWNKKEKVRECKVCGKKLHSQTKSGYCNKHYHTEEYNLKLSQKLKGKTGGYNKGSGRGKHGWYKGYWCDSSWELAWVIYHLENNIEFKRNTERFNYIYENKSHYYIPDFKINDTFIEIKGYINEQTKEKIKQFPYKLQILQKDDMQNILSYVINKYGKKFIQMYEMHP